MSRDTALRLLDLAFTWTLTLTAIGYMNRERIRAWLDMRERERREARLVDLRTQRRLRFYASPDIRARLVSEEMNDA
jgi:hypothetical protein